jgi:hypothetical protein
MVEMGPPAASESALRVGRPDKHMQHLKLSALMGDRHPFASFHDAMIHTLHLDYETRVLQMECTLWVGDMDAPPGPLREATADGTLTLTGLLYCVIDPPDVNSNFENGGLDITSDGSVATTKFHTPPPELPPVPDEAFVHWFFVNNWNSLIYIAATDAHFVWK